MPYTLAKWAIWLIAAALVGGVVGWLLHGLRRPQEVAEPTDNAEIARIRDLAYREGMKPLRISGAMKVASGLTTLAEVFKVAPPSERS